VLEPAACRVVRARPMSRFSFSRSAAIGSLVLALFAVAGTINLKVIAMGLGVGPWP